MLVGAGFADPVMEMEPLTVTYADSAALMRELKALGATNATRGRPRGLTGPTGMPGGARSAYVAHVWRIEQADRPNRKPQVVNHLGFLSGADDGNRTRVISLED